MIRIGINALYLIPGRVGGTEIYLRNVLNACALVDSQNQYFVFRNSETGSDLVPRVPNFHDRPQPVSGSLRPARMLYEQIVLPWACARLHLDVLFNAGFTAPLLCGCPMVTVFHDLQYKRHPEYFRWFDLPFWRLMLPLSAARSRRIVVLSEAVASDLEHFYRYLRARITVIPHGIEPEFARIAERRLMQKRERRLILSVSTLHPHKNIGALLAAFQQFLREKPGWKLCVAGLKGFETEAIESRLRELGLEGSVTLTGWVPRDELYGFFEAAESFIYPSRFEGFGIPVLEALASGIPTACSRLPSLVEIAGGAARFFDPEDIDDLVRALDEVTSDPALRERLAQAGPERARAYAWDQSARTLVNVLTEASQPVTRSKKSQD